MSTENKEFFDLLNSITSEQTFSLDLSPRGINADSVAVCKQLTTLQLKSLIETVVDNKLTQYSFNSTVTKVFKDSLITSLPYSLNIIDRLLFILKTRIQALSSTVTIRENGEMIVVDLIKVSNNLLQRLKENQSLLVSSSATEGKITVNFGVALLDAEAQLNEEFYRDFNPDIEDTEELRMVLGDSFINEIAKSLQSVTVGEKTLDLSTVSFSARLKTIETLPASLIQEVIKYIEKYKQLIDASLTVEGHSIPINASLFSLR